MIPDLSEYRDKLIGKLQTVSRQTETIYLHLGKHFPELLGEMDSGLAGARAFVSNLEGVYAGGGGQNGHIGAFLTRLRKTVDASERDLAALHAADRNVLVSIDDRLGKLSSLSGYIGAIHQDSEEMEIISLNAMVMGIKAGAAGKAFSYITEELKRLSTRTIGLSEETIRRGHALSQRFSAFQNLLKEAREEQESFHTEFRRRLDASLTEFHSGLKSCVAGLQLIIEASTSVRSPLLRIMEEIQLQDIIRQSIDHVIISLHELKEVQAGIPEDAILDELSFIKALPDVCESLIHDIALKIEQSLAVLRRETGSVRTDLDEMERDRSAFLAGALSARDSASMAALLESFGSLFSSIIADLDRSLSRKERIRQESRQLLSEIFQMEKSFRTFESIVSRFRTIDIASRIEVAKQTALKQNANAVGEMNRLTIKIDADVAESLLAIKSFIKDTSVTIAAYTDHLRLEDTFVKSFEKETRLLHGQLDEARNDLVRSLANFSPYSRKFMELLNTTRADLDILAVLRSEILGLKQPLAEIRQQAGDALRPFLERRGMQSWRIENAKLQDIINRFTIFTHKKAAGEIAGFSVEEGSTSGELVLF